VRARHETCRGGHLAVNRQCPVSSDERGDLALRVRNTTVYHAIVKVRIESPRLSPRYFYGAGRVSRSRTDGVFEQNEFDKRIISSFSTGREIIGYNLADDNPTNRPLSKAEFVRGD